MDVMQNSLDRGVCAAQFSPGQPEADSGNNSLFPLDFWEVLNTLHVSATFVSFGKWMVGSGGLMNIALDQSWQKFIFWGPSDSSTSPVSNILHESLNGI